MKESPVLWCTECQTSIAQAELETKECETTFNYLNFATPVGTLLIATTRPELLAGCVCILCIQRTAATIIILERRQRYRYMILRFPFCPMRPFPWKRNRRGYVRYFRGFGRHGLV